MAETHETVADIIAEMRKISAEKYRLSSENGGAYGNPGVYHLDFAQFARVISDRLEAAYKREIDEAERRANHAAIKNVSETLAKVGPLYDAESIGNAAKLREAIEDLFAKGCVSRHDRVAVCPPCIDNEGYSPSNEWCARCSSDVKEKCMAIYNARAALAATEKEGGNNANE